MLASQLFHSKQGETDKNRQGDVEEAYSILKSSDAVRTMQLLLGVPLVGVSALPPPMACIATVSD